MTIPAEDLWALFCETDRKFQESDARLTQCFEETDLGIQGLSALLGRQGNRLGEFVQEMLRPAVVCLLRERGLPVHQVAPNLMAYDDNGQVIAEVDLLAANVQVAVAVECKSHLSLDDVNEPLERLAQFKTCFPQYCGHPWLGVVAGRVVPDQVGRCAYRKGLFVLVQSGQSVEIRNDAKFQPRIW